MRALRDLGIEGIGSVLTDGFHLTTGVVTALGLRFFLIDHGPLTQGYVIYEPTLRSAGDPA